MIDIQEAVMEAVLCRRVQPSRCTSCARSSVARTRKRGEKRVRAPLARCPRRRLLHDGEGRDRGDPGQNGSGKSTLVRLLDALLPDGGYARILGHDVVAEHRAVRRLVNRVSVEASFFKKMSASENLSYAPATTE